MRRTTADRPPTAEERYLSSLRGSNLRTTADRVTDADALLAAGLVAGSDPRMNLALSVYGVLAHTEMRGATQVAEAMSVKLSRRRHGPRIKRVEAYDLALLLLKVWHKRTCPECGGRGHPLVPGTPVMNELQNCPHCHGTGQIPLERIFQSHQIDHARWLESEINTLNSLIFAAMAKKLNSHMEL